MSVTVNFTDQSTAGPSGPITDWAWDFGDGNTSTLQNPSNAYATAGTYTVTLTVIGTSPDGSATVSQPVNVIDTGGGGSLSFTSLTDWPRPSFTPIRTVNFTTKAQLDTAIADMQAGDLIQYTGTGILTISSGSTNGYSIQNKNPASSVVIDLGTGHSIWDSGAVSGDYVKFAYTGTANFSAFWVNACSNLRIYGGDFTSGGYGITINAPSHDITWWDAYIHNVGSSGISVRGTTSGGSSSDCHNLNLRAEVNRFALNPALDNHPDKGTGLHACILHGNTGNIHDSIFTIYGHDALAPGETSHGHTWPEGGGGSVIEAGNVSGTNYANCTYYAKGENNLMRPNGTNPGSTAQQTGGNVFNLWGNVALNGNVIGWAEGINITGAVVHGSGGSWFPGSPAIKVLHGRGTNTNQFVGSGGNVADRYVTGKGISYTDCL